MTLRPPTPSPCTFCPYRRDVPSGIWGASEYAKLARYDAQTGEQPHGIFQCHVKGQDSDSANVCGGWAGCHDGNHLLALRLNFAHLTEETYNAIVDYVSPVPLFSSGQEAADHGMREIGNPSEKARHAIAKLQRTRSDLTFG